MLQEERNLLVADIKSQIIKELTGQDLRPQNQRNKPLSDLYDKYRGPLYEKYGVKTWADIWEHTRRLSILFTGNRYIRDLLPSEEEIATEFAESILKQFINLEGE
ncbi:hypothetical protein [Amphibacillus jilinensis]|uniref:hypothetical protein n=1 Tax=Amphibacillus jilinensis TaxID=1216008 RepID=UPI0002EE698E|nr:hypothetical protein [Amphibacillus jilinensis]